MYQQHTTLYVTEIKETYFEISCPLALHLLDISKLPFSTCIKIMSLYSKLLIFT